MLRLCENIIVLKRKRDDLVFSMFLVSYLCFLSKTASVSDAVFFGVSQLKIVTARIDTELLLAHVLKVDRVFLRTNATMSLGFWQKFVFGWYVLDRKKNKPMAYILGFKDWFGFRIKVNRFTLIPRDETEVLMHHIQNFSREFVPQSALDIGTGSGCISLGLKKIFPPISVLALDISPKALLVAQKNFGSTGSLTTKQSDLLEIIELGNCYDVMVANLPYVPTNILVTTEVEREPSTAIFSGVDGLEHIRRLSQQLLTKKIVFKELWLEFLPEQAASVQAIFLNYNVSFLPDVGGDIYFALIQPHTQ